MKLALSRLLRLGSGRTDGLRVLLALPFLLAAFAVACSDDSERSPGIIHRILLAAESQDPDRLDSYPGRLPEGIPVTPPLYPDADLIVSSRQPVAPSDAATPAAGDNIAEPLLYFIVLDTADDRSDVFEYYEAALDQAPWQLESSFSSAQVDTLSFTNIDDADISGAVSIASGGEDGHTSVLISMQDAGAFREEAPPFELGGSVTVPAGFPPEIPIYEDATLTDTGFFRMPSADSYLIVFLTTASQDAVMDFYRSAFQEPGWTVTDTPPVGLETGITFSDKLGDIQGEVAADRFSEDPGYTQVRIQVRANPSREPAETPSGRTATPEPSETPAD